jgi:hydroxymethylpyrimidine/phosphomethylpyrimidine kinase
MKFTEMLMKEIDEILQEMFTLPFIIELSNGTLPKEKFLFYLQQDLEYLRDYAKGWEIMASKSKSKEEIKIFNELAKSIYEVEIDKIHHKLIQKNVKIRQSPNCLLYTSYLLRVAHERPLYESISAYLSCFLVYETVGRHILKISNIEENPYKDWIENYSSDEYSQTGLFILGLMDSYALELDEEQKSHCIDHFVNATQMEYLFWDSAYKMDSFEIKRSKSKPVCVLSIAGSDSGGGAGIQADLNTFSNHQVFGTTVITALTAQNTKGVHHIEKSSSMSVIHQLKAIKSDISIHAIKIGMLFDKDIILGVYDQIRDMKCPIVLDPVMISTSGDTLLKNEAISLLCEKMIPSSTLITPNLDEAKVLLSKIDTKMEILSVSDIKEVAKMICDSFKVKNVLIKGGHLNIEGFVFDVLYESENNDPYSIFKHEFVENNNTHGSGCSLSASIASNLAKGFNLKNSVEKSINYIHLAIVNGFKIGNSNYGTLNHLLKN